MNILVTGGAGFIGSHVVDLCLEKNFDVTVLDNFSTGRSSNLAHVSNQINLVECDLAIQGDWADCFENKDAVIHLAALADIVPSIKNPVDYYQSNVTGTFNVLRAAQSNSVKRLIYSASSSCYGLANDTPTPENAAKRPEYPYALTKWLGEELVLHWAQVYDLNATSLRFFNVYGPRSRTSGTYGAMFGVFLAQKLAGKPFTVVGDGTQRRDFTYVIDVAEAVLACLDADLKGMALNVGSGDAVSVNQIVDLLGGEKVFIPKRPGEPNITHADISKIIDLVGWQPRISIREGVELVLREIEYWSEAVVWTPDTIAEATKDWFSYLSKKD